MWRSPLTTASPSPPPPMWGPLSTRLPRPRYVWLTHVREVIPLANTGPGQTCGYWLLQDRFCGLHRSQELEGNAGRLHPEEAEGGLDQHGGRGGEHGVFCVWDWEDWKFTWFVEMFNVKNLYFPIYTIIPLHPNNCHSMLLPNYLSSGTMVSLIDYVQEKTQWQ